MTSNSATAAPALLVTVHTQVRDGVPGKLLAHGFMTSGSTVLVPDPPRELASPWRRYILRISRSPGHDGTAEVLPVAGIGLAAVHGDGISTAAALLTLIWPTRFEVPTVTSTPERITELLVRHHGDQWAVYAELGFRVVRPARKPGPADEWWLGPAFEQDVHSSAEDFSCGTCGSSPVCCRRPAPRAAAPAADAA
ncbi:hypothetical protein [Kitasatospora purpeofusca]|uniref:Uncharacterized protein n=1 Tax=Kitasatospora purpeofusca TaxID=67352 RepID=A0ABZ1U8L4_9ACTN|nr:hypothetical protein [Kitasatospora purpeofusca]